jgi:hypothetical protein
MGGTPARCRPRAIRLLPFPAMNDLGARILDHLAAVDRERRARLAKPALGRKALELKRYQQSRFARTHADLLVHPRFGQAANFFLADLYGPQDFTQRDAQFARIVPAIVRMFPEDIVATVESLAALHALSEHLDSAMAGHLDGATASRASYVAAWQATGEPASRARQIELVLLVGRALERHTRSRLLRASLKAMRGPARAAGMGALQGFLESGFEAFASMGGAGEFLATIETREHALANRLFERNAAADASARVAPDDVLAQLP